MLMLDQHLYKSPAIDVMTTADYYCPDWECLVDFFLQSGVEKLLAGIEPTTTTLDLSSQSGAYDLSAMATPMIFLTWCIVDCNIYKNDQVWYDIQSKYSFCLPGFQPLSSLIKISPTVRPSSVLIFFNLNFIFTLLYFPLSVFCS